MTIAHNESKFWCFKVEISQNFGFISKKLKDKPQLVKNWFFKVEISQNFSFIGQNYDDRPNLIKILVS